MRRIMRRVLAGGAVVLVAAAVGAVAVAPPAHAATVVVTTTADVVNPGDGLVSLREAVGTANAAAGATTVQLSRALYQLSICGADEDANANGDLDFVPSTVLTIDGNGATIQQTCRGRRIVQALGAGGGLVVTDATLTGGSGPQAAISYNGGDVDLTGVTVSGNDAGAGRVIGSFGPDTGATLDIVDSTIGPNTGTGVQISFGTVTIVDSTVSGNTGRGVGLVDGALTVSGSTVSDNGAGGVSTTGQGNGVFTLTDTVVQDNGGTGVFCSNCGDLVVSGATITGNHPTGADDGGGIAVSLDLDQPTDALSVSVTDSTVSGNARTGAGGGMAVTVTEDSGEAAVTQITVTRSTFSANTTSGPDGRGGGISAMSGELRVDNSTVAGNVASAKGGGVYTSTGNIYLRHATIAGNTAPSGTNVATGMDLHAFASIVAGGLGGGIGCWIAGTTTSAGYNFSGDASCAFVEGPGDVNNGGDPQLGALADNGGPTQTRLPAAAGPVAGLLPAAACTVFGTDQRGVVRPQGTDCEPGAVEITEGRRRR
ncbi:right-handed parallel beta-helix repeat-containing protein [Virgisporangium ochraceum]|nr:right-handed parallel beta-helix repeat-containing protein [Virgisporangium ochraceum]